MDHRTVLTAIVGIILSAGLSTVTDASNWGYEGERGTNYWVDLFPEACAGEYQSPINIDTPNTVYDPELRDFSIFFDPPLPGSKFIVKNNGHAVQVDTQGEFYVTNGGLKNVYRTAQFHFHWGHANHHGSEHTVNGQAAPIEMHIVNWNKDTHDSIGKAVVAPAGLAVLGILFEISEQDNMVLEPLVNTLMKIRDPDQKLTHEIPAVSIRNFLPRAHERYYRYNGSLTTPGCFESVVWTVFHEKQTISRRQLRVFRQVLKPRHKVHKRSAQHGRHVLDEVMGELGIRGDSFGDSLERSRLRRQLETMKDQATHTVAANSTGPAHTGSHTGHTMPMTDGGAHAPEHTAHASDPIPVPISASGNAKETAKVEDIRKMLVNNFRPVQPLNGRTVYRSFPFFDEPVAQETRVVYVEKEVMVPASAATNIVSLSVVTLLTIAQRFLS